MQVAKWRLHDPCYRCPRYLRDRRQGAQALAVARFVAAALRLLRPERAGTARRVALWRSFVALVPVELVVEVRCVARVLFGGEAVATVLVW